MIVALDVGYQDLAGVVTGRCAAVAFERWDSREAVQEVVVDVAGVLPYTPGRLFERELPCLIAGLDALRAARPRDRLSCVLVDGNVRLDDQGRPGLGAHLYRHLSASVPVVGVAKTSFVGLDAVKVLRGASTRPLYITAAGMTDDRAARRVQGMAGTFRIPTLIKRADQLTRST